MTLAETLRAAAARVRDIARAATPGPWRWGDWNARWGTVEQERNTLEHAPAHGPFPDVARSEIETTLVLNLVDPLESDPEQEPNAEHIVLWHPGVALAVADWLDDAAEDADQDPEMTSSRAAALAVARLLLPAEPTEGAQP